MDDFFSAIGDALDAGLQFVMQVIVYLFTLLAAVAQFIWDVLNSVFGFFLQTSTDTQGFLQFAQDGFFKGIFSAILKGIIAFGSFLAQIFGPIVKWLKEARQWIDRIYKLYLGPILKILRIARVFLTLLKALGVKWAGKLDNILGTIQNDIQRAFLLVKQYINTFVDLLNILADPTNLLRRPTTLLSLRRIWNAFQRQITGLPPGFYLPSPSKFAGPGMGFVGANFNRNDPLQNPPASFYLSADAGVPSFDFLGPGDTIPDTSIDDVSAYDFYNADYGLDIVCDDPDQCMQDAVQIVLGS